MLVEEDARVAGAIVWPNTRIGRDAVVDGAIIGRSCHVGRNARVGATAILGDKTDAHRFHPGVSRRRMTCAINTEIFKAYDVRGLYPAELDEDVVPASSAAPSSPYLGPKRIGGRRATCALSSPSLTAAFIDGVTRQGVDVVDYGLAGTDMMYFAVASDGLDGGAQITASHNPKQYNGCKMVKAEAFPLSGESGITRDARDAARRHAAGAGRARGHA